jgi:hypothetical protein
MAEYQERREEEGKERVNKTEGSKGEQRQSSAEQRRG